MRIVCPSLEEAKQAVVCPMQLFTKNPDEEEVQKNIEALKVHNPSPLHLSSGRRQIHANVSCKDDKGIPVLASVDCGGSLWRRRS
jgi:hypothetical protein